MHAAHTNWIDDFERPFGMLGAPIQYALPRERHMYEYGTTSEQFGAIAVACRKHAPLTPNAVLTHADDAGRSPSVAHGRRSVSSARLLPARPTARAPSS